MSDVIAHTGAWSADDKALLGRIAQLVIGDDPSALLPSVTDSAIFANILQTAAEFDAPIRRGIAALHGMSGKRPLSEVDDNELSALLQSGAETRSLHRAMMQLVPQCFYQDDRVLRALGFEPRPPYPGGHIVEDGDWSLLDAVRARGPIYRST